MVLPLFTLPPRTFKKADFAPSIAFKSLEMSQPEALKIYD